MKNPTLKSIGAVAAGLFFIVMVSTVIDLILHAVHVYPPVPEPLTDGTALLASSYRLVISIVGAWLTARLAPARPLKHAVILGCIGTVLGLAGVIATWNLNLGPRWYPISLAVLAIPQCWFGGWLYARKLSGSGV
jgi:Co/Zn/Cd efflux system component